MQWSQSTLNIQCVADEMITSLTTCLCFLLCLLLFSKFDSEVVTSVSQSTSPLCLFVLSFMLFPLPAVRISLPSAGMTSPQRRLFFFFFFNSPWVSNQAAATNGQRSPVVASFICSWGLFYLCLMTSPNLRALAFLSSSQRLNLPLSSCHHKWDTYCSLK